MRGSVSEISSDVSFPLRQPLARSVSSSHLPSRVFSIAYFGTGITKKGVQSNVGEKEIGGSMGWWEKVMFSLRRLWVGIATRLGIRKEGLLKLRHDVRTCEYEDVHVMWDMLKKTDTEPARSPIKKPKRTLLKVVRWARSAPRLSRADDHLIVC